jgi:hypothetical protein
MMSLDIYHRQFDSLAKVTSLTQGGITIEKIHIIDLEQLEWAERCFKAWQCDADFRQVAIPEKPSGKSFDNREATILPFT